ncbi:tyrosine--tRNA ligase, partial [Alphaproteobacteria bacterium]|nr:tyrosine--tRNA ligase [Alphaproteobacteria bacterium]
MTQSLFIKTLLERGFIHQCTDMDGLDKKMNNEVVPTYIGFDVTADSLHIGSLLPIMMLRYLQKCGHKPIVLMGGATTRVGDPSGKNESRKMLSDDDIKKNMTGIKKIFEQFLTFGDGKTDAVMVNNDDWLKDINYIEFLRDYGKNFSVNRMLTFDSVKLRLDRQQPLSFLEFNYMLLQAYDFMELNRKMNVGLQMGGSDQWGNIVNGVELSRRINNSQVYGLTVPLLTTASGAKMGKTADGAVWLNQERLSDFDYWQFWRNTEDDDVSKFLKLFTELPMSEIAKLEKLQGAEINSAKEILANEATKLCRGENASLSAQKTANDTFSGAGLGADLPTLPKTQPELDNGLGLLSILTEFGFTDSNGDARRQIQGGAVKINDVKIQDTNYII